MPIIPHSSYISPPILFNRHLQTIVPALFRKIKDLQYQRERLHTPDDDFLDLDWYYRGNDKLVILSHGLEGDSQRPYMQGMIRAFIKNGWDCLAWNFRGCSGEINKQLRFYHSGATEDLELVIQHALKKSNYKSIILIGFSLGGNLTLKYVGEKGNNIEPLIKRALAFSVPLDLHGSCLKISERSNYIYSRRFLRNLKGKVKAKALIMPDQINTNGFPNIKKIIEFDDLYTAPIHGFTNAREYYKACSSLYFLDKIKIPTLIINALNDPFLSTTCFPFESLRQNMYVHFEAPKEGGHCGFALFNEDHYWSELRALEFAAEIDIE